MPVGLHSSPLGLQPYEFCLEPQDIQSLCVTTERYHRSLGDRKAVYITGREDLSN
jgi:hypothetical protein